jgi:HAD superfamily hydrolase (TIGR01549 family)
MKPLIGFDMDGVIIDSEDFSEANWITAAFMKTLAEFGIPESEENARALYVKNMRENSAAFCQRFGIDDPRLLWDRREAHYIAEKLAALETGQIHLYQDVSALEELSHNYSLGLVSNSPQVVVDCVIAHFSLERLFRVWIGRGSVLADLHRAKPAPDMLNEMKTLIGTDQGYYVGDQPEDVEAARAASLHPIHLTRNGISGDIHTLTKLGDYLKGQTGLRDREIESLSDLAIE